MLKFKPQLLDDGSPVTPLRNCYLLGGDGNALRGEIAYEDGLIVCEKRETGPAALALMHGVGEMGELTLQTCLLPEQDEPYLLNLELARHRLMTIFAKIEDWAMFDVEPTHPAARRTELARKLFIEALCVQHEDPERASALSADALTAAVDGSEELALSHAELLLNRRRDSGMLPKSLIGTGVQVDQSDERLRHAIPNSFDFIQLPMAWRRLTPEEHGYRWGPFDNWVQWAASQSLPLVAGPLVSFDPAHTPDWLYIWEHDYDTVRDLVYEHIERVVERYRGGVAAWNVVSGLHVNSHFSFNFEQLMDLTRMATMLVKKAHPQSKVLIELREPFGEYYATNIKSIPPMMYSDLLVQSAIQFDAMAVRVNVGQAVSGQYTRDLMQLSHLLDTLAGCGKPLHVTLAAPSEPVTSMMIASQASEEPVDDRSGAWRRAWTPTVQSRWLEAAFQIAASKPFVEAVAWSDLMDHAEIDLPLSGLLTEEMQTRESFRRLMGFRRNLQRPVRASRRAAGGAVTPGGQPGSPPGVGAGVGVVADRVNGGGGI